MSEEGYTSSESNSESEDDGIFCRSCSPQTRKVGYFITFIIGMIMFGIGVILTAFMIDGGVPLLIVGSIVVLFCPLWYKSPKSLVVSFKNPLRLSSLLIYLGILVVTIIFAMGNNDFLKALFGILLACAGIWYFLSYFENGQNALIQCCKTCFKKNPAPSE